MPFNALKWIPYNTITNVVHTFASQKSTSQNVFPPLDLGLVLSWYKPGHCYAGLQPLATQQHSYWHRHYMNFTT